MTTFSVLNNHGMLSMATWRGLLQLYKCASDPSKAIVRPVRNGLQWWIFGAFWYVFHIVCFAQRISSSLAFHFLAVFSGISSVCPVGSHADPSDWFLIYNGDNEHHRKHDSERCEWHSPAVKRTSLFCAARKLVQFHKVVRLSSQTPPWAQGSRTMFPVSSKQTTFVALEAGKQSQMSKQGAQHGSVSSHWHTVAGRHHCLQIRHPPQSNFARKTAIATRKGGRCKRLCQHRLSMGKIASHHEFQSKLNMFPPFFPLLLLSCLAPMPNTWLPWIFSFLSVGSIRFADLFSLPLLHLLDWRLIMFTLGICIALLWLWLSWVKFMWRMARTVGSIYGSSARSSGPFAGALPAACATMTGCTMEDSRNRSVKITEIAIVDVNLGCTVRLQGDAM